MSYFIDVDEDMSNQLQKKLRAIRDRMSGNDIRMRLRIKRAEAALRDRVITHDTIEAFMDRLLSEKIDPLDWYYQKDPEASQVTEVVRNIGISSKHKYVRGRVGNLQMKKIMEELIKFRIKDYLSTDMEPKKILCIVGTSGSGKTLASLHLKYHKGANVICSFTTRPPRSTEVEGRDHHFVDIVPDRSSLLAFTHFSRYYYYALKEQVFGPCTVYVIDEKGLLNLKRDHGDEYRIWTVYMRRDTALRKKSGVDYSRIRRDEARITLPEGEYDYIINNNGTKKELFNNIERIYETILNVE